jgi:hypothetical protein
MIGKKKEEGRGKKEEGRGKKEEGRGKREEGRRKTSVVPAMTRRLKPMQGVPNRMCSHLAIFTPLYKNSRTPPRTKKIPDLV